MSDQNGAFTPLNDLEALLVRAATEEAARPAFARAILDAQLYAVTSDEGPLGERTAEPGATVSLIMVPLEGGEAATAVFTAPERIAQVGAGGRYIGMLGRDLIGMVADRPLLLNPGLGFGVLWTPEDLALMLGRPVTRTVETDTQVLLGHPAEEPGDLVMRLMEAFQPIAEIENAWLALAQWPERQEYAWYLDVRSTLSPDRLNLLLGRAVDGADLRGLNLDMTVGPPGGAPGTGIPVVRRG